MTPVARQENHAHANKYQLTKQEANSENNPSSMNHTLKNKATSPRVTTKGNTNDVDIHDRVE